METSVMNDDDLEPLAPLEPLEPAAPRATSDAPSGAGGAPPRGRRGRRAQVVLVGTAVLCIAAVAWVAISTDHRRRAHDERVSGAVTSATATVPPTTVPSFGPDPFGASDGRFAAVVDGHLWLVDAARREARGVRGVDRARIVAVSGWSLLVQSDEPRDPGRRFVVDGRSGDAHRAAGGTWLPRIGGGWWIANGRDLSSGAEHVVVPAGVVPLAQVNGGFVVAASSGGALAFWDPRSGSRRALGNAPYTRLLGADVNRIALAGPRCPSPSSPRCSIEIVDVATGRITTLPVPFVDQFVRNAVFSADGRRMAMWGTRGVSLLDTASGSSLVTLRAARLATSPLTFTADARALLVLEDPEPYRQVVVLRAADGRFVRTWVSAQLLEQLVAFAGP
jgi:hypothetical protein